MFEQGRDVAGVTDDALIDAICEREREVARSLAWQCALIAELARRRPARPEDGGGSASGISEFVVDELAVALRLSRAAAGGRVQVAVELDRRLPATAAALGRGEIDFPKARAVVDAVGQLDDAPAAAVETQVLARAPEQTVGQLRASLTRAVLTVDPAGSQARHEQATSDRRVAVTPLSDGMAELWAMLPADAATAIYGAVNEYARREPADDRGIDARRADALVALVTGAATVPMRPLVHLTVAATTLLGLDQAPGELAGHGPVPATVARRLAADPTGTWRRILTDPATGAVVEVGHTTYRPPAATARHVTVRDRTCRFPGCRQPAHRCDLDHVTPWPTGPTTPANLITLCRRHHRLKHSGGWQIITTGDAIVTWTTPTGRSHTTTHHPPTHWPRPAETHSASCAGSRSGLAGTAPRRR